MGKATGKTFEQWLEEDVGTWWAFVHQDQISVLGRNDADDGVECEFTTPPRLKPDGTIREGREIAFTIPDSVHEFPEATGRSDFRRYALLVGAFLAKGGDISDVSDPFHEDEDE